MSEQLRKLVGSKRDHPPWKEIRFRCSFHNTIYDVLKARGFRETENDLDWDLFWCDKDLLAMIAGVEEQQETYSEFSRSLTDAVGSLKMQLDTMLTDVQEHVENATQVVSVCTTKQIESMQAQYSEDMARMGSIIKEHDALNQRVKEQEDSLQIGLTGVQQYFGEKIVQIEDIINAKKKPDLKQEEFFLEALKDGQTEEAQGYAACSPTTFVLPLEYSMFVEEFKKQQASGTIWIMKPVGKSQGRGIFLFDRLSQVSSWRQDISNRDFGSTSDRAC
eukprot:g21578.t1